MALSSCRVAMGRRALAFLVCLTCLAAAQAQDDDAAVWRFVVFGDTRDNTRATATGISAQLGRIVHAIAEERPALVIHSGDLINGYYTLPSSPVHGQYVEQFENWKAALRPLHDFDTGRGVPLYVVRGNHEDGELATDGRLKEAYRESIGRHMPQNGPADEKGLTYVATYRQAAFLALDEYSVKELGLLRGLVDQPWLDGELARLPRPQYPFLFVIGHQPAFKVSTWKKGPFPDLFAFPDHRDAFWKSLQTAGVSFYFCGHVHFYARVAKGGVQQVLIGNGGADTVAFDPRQVDPAVTLEFPQQPVAAADIKPGYVVLTVDERRGSISAVQKLWNERTGQWESGDRFQLPAMVGADRDAHGCIGSAGYLWCAREAACRRPWELAAEKGFQADAEGFRAYCGGGR